MSEPLIPVPGRLHSVATEGHLVGTDEVIDEHLGEVQSVINARYDQKLDLIINDIDQSREIILDKLDDTEELDHYHATGYIIDQTNSLGLAETFIRKNIASKDAIKTIQIEGEEKYIDVIKRIWANTKLCVGIYDSTNKILKCKEVSREDKRLYADGTSVSISSSDEYDMFMKLPAFYWRCVETDTDIYHVEFSMSDDYVDNTWHYWDGDTFIGVYKGYVNNNKLYSKPGVTPTGGVSLTNFKAYAYSRCNDFEYSCITYESHKMMALLGFGWLNTTAAQNIIGKGTNSNKKTTGLCDELGITDGMNQSINFWGLENWWGDGQEKLDNLVTANETMLVNVLDQSGSVKYSLQGAGISGVSIHNISKIHLGTRGDIIPKNIETTINYNRCYASYGHVRDAANMIGHRAGAFNNDSNGLIQLEMSVNGSDTNPSVVTRLQYKGNYEFVDSF